MTEKLKDVDKVNRDHIDTLESKEAFILPQHRQHDLTVEHPQEGTKRKEDKPH